MRELGDETPCLMNCKNKEMSKTRPEFINSIHQKQRGTQKLKQEDICQNDEIITEREFYA